MKGAKMSNAKGDDESTESVKDQVGLKRELGLFSAISMIVAVMIGIYSNYLHKKLIIFFLDTYCCDFFPIINYFLAIYKKYLKNCYRNNDKYNNILNYFESYDEIESCNFRRAESKF